MDGTKPQNDALTDQLQAAIIPLRPHHCDLIAKMRHIML